MDYITCPEEEVFGCHCCEKFDVCPYRDNPRWVLSWVAQRAAERPAAANPDWDEPDSTIDPAAGRAAVDAVAQVARESAEMCHREVNRDEN